jgi:hypothetical protein
MNGAARHLDLVAHASIRRVQCSKELSNDSWQTLFELPF